VDLTVGARTVQAGAIAVPDQGRVLLTLRDVTEARAVDAVRRDFVANASHELKTPVASIRALAETIATSAGDDPRVVPRFARQLEREAVRLSRIVSDLLDLSRLEGHPGTFSLLRLDLLVPQEAERLTARAAEAHLRLAIHTPEAVTIRGSAQDLGLMLRNLVENAIQYTRPGGSVDVGLDTENGWARLSVADTGLGIPAREQGRIFERFYRVDRARSRETGGTGLGLSIVRHVAENHGGTVAVSSALGQGSTFTVRLPVAGP
jgi:two-component system sensor histidine kinase SenX3